MRRSRPYRSSVPVLLPALLLAAFALIAVACNDAGSADTTTAALPTTSAPAPDEAVAQQTGGGLPAGAILFHDDFQDGDSQGWQVDGAWVVRQDGDLYTFSTSGQGYAPVPAGVGWDGDYAYRANYLLESGTLAFTFDATTGGRYYVPIDAGYISLVKEEAGEPTVLTQAPAPEAGVQHNIVMAKQRGTIQVYVDKVLWLSYQDSSPLSAGTIAVGAIDGTTAWVDDVLVNKIQVQLPQKAPAVAPVDPGKVVDPEDDGADLDSLPEDPDDVPALPANNVPDEMPELQVEYYARWNEATFDWGESFAAAPGDQIFFVWDVQNALEVYFSELRVQSQGSYPVAVTTGHEYELCAVDLAGEPHYYRIEVRVEGGGPDVAARGPDLSIEVEVTPLGERQVHVAIGVTNVGDETAWDFVVRWYAHGQSGVADQTKTYPAFDAGGVNWFYFDYTYQGHGTMHWRATIDEQGDVDDIDRGNNTVRGTVEIE